MNGIYSLIKRFISGIECHRTFVAAKSFTERAARKGLRFVISTCVCGTCFPDWVQLRCACVLGP